MGLLVEKVIWVLKNEPVLLPLFEKLYLDSTIVPENNKKQAFLEVQVKK